MSNIKVGDKLICKKSYLFLFKKGEKYLITDIRYDYDLNDHKIVLSSDTNGQYWFLLSNIENEFFIYKWFYDVSYERKKKLKKLNKLSKKI